MAAELPGVRDAQQNHILQRLYDSEINFVVRGFWDGGFDWALGDEVNGIVAAGNAMTLDQPLADLAQAAVEHFPDSAFAKG